MVETLCEPAENGWRCSKMEDGRWVPYDVYATVVLDGRPVTLPPLSGKVLFDDENCDVVMERGLKLLVCKKSRS